MLTKLKSISPVVWLLLGIAVIVVVIAYRNYQKTLSDSKNMAQRIFSESGKTEITLGELVDRTKQG